MIMDLVSKTCLDINCHALLGLLGHTMILALVSENLKGYEIIVLCKDFLGHIMILDCVSKTCREMKLSYSVRTFWAT